jgi:hypothetical protein
MGGVSEGHMTYEQIEGRRALCMRGRIRLENNGGFLQLVLDLSLNGSLDASTYEGARLIVRSNAEPYNLHLETGDTPLPWQSYRHSFENSPPSFPTLLGGVAPEGRSRPNAAFDIVGATGRCQSQSGPYENQ